MNNSRQKKSLSEQKDGNLTPIFQNLTNLFNVCCGISTRDFKTFCYLLYLFFVYKVKKVEKNGRNLKKRRKNGNKVFLLERKAYLCPKSYGLRQLNNYLTL